MDRQPVSSSNIESIGYDSDSKTLEVEFQGGSIWQYADVEKNVHEELMSSASVGAYFAKMIRGNYAENKIQ